MQNQLLFFDGEACFLIPIIISYNYTFLGNSIASISHICFVNFC